MQGKGEAQQVLMLEREQSERGSSDKERRGKIIIVDNLTKVHSAEAQGIYTKVRVGEST